MKNEDVALNQRILAGDEAALREFDQKVRETGSRAGIAANRRFSDRRRYCARDLRASLSAVGNLGRPETLSKVALCDCESTLYRVAPQKQATNPAMKKPTSQR